MTRDTGEPLDDLQFHAVLEGGPMDLPHEARWCSIASDQDKVKLPFGGGYEHFERVDVPPADVPPGPVVFRWTTRTKIAE
ncbi:DUF5988 family protein [Cryptosporangium japonicum]|uniref:Uncharacterized protein n=1 Tax=Cryptosporangium japonicum TaxID=80872 RepID=A0ABN0TK49_9ACTN